MALGLGKCGNSFNIRKCSHHAERDDYTANTTTENEFAAITKMSKGSRLSTITIFPQDTRQYSAPGVPRRPI
jgi:hypothetical protein